MYVSCIAITVTCPVVKDYLVSLNIQIEYFRPNCMQYSSQILVPLKWQVAWFPLGDSFLEVQQWTPSCSFGSLSALRPFVLFEIQTLANKISCNFQTWYTRLFYWRELRWWRCQTCWFLAWNLSPGDNISFAFWFQAFQLNARLRHGPLRHKTCTHHSGSGDADNFCNVLARSLIRSTSTVKSSGICG